MHRGPRSIIFNTLLLWHSCMDSWKSDPKNEMALRKALVSIFYAQFFENHNTWNTPLVSYLTENPKMLRLRNSFICIKAWSGKTTSMSKHETTPLSISIMYFILFSLVFNCHSSVKPDILCFCFECNAVHCIWNSCIGCSTAGWWETCCGISANERRPRH